MLAAYDRGCVITLLNREMNKTLPHYQSMQIMNCLVTF